MKFLTQINHFTFYLFFNCNIVLCFSKFANGDEVLQAAKYMVALQIAREPLVRKCVREVFFERARINVYPTKKGQKVIDESHNCYR